MSRAQWRRPWMLVLSGLGWAMLLLIWLPALRDVLPWRVQIVPSDPACGWVISTNGRIHGPDSPHRPQVNPTICFPTRAAAEAALQSE
jgi:hypothetical protein